MEKCDEIDPLSGAVCTLEAHQGGSHKDMTDVGCVIIWNDDSYKQWLARNIATPNYFLHPEDDNEDQRQTP